jgi:diguanylate cyclase (GGDEF)-like protein/PAS domain S-box-containing protein
MGGYHLVSHAVNGLLHLEAERTAHEWARYFAERVPDAGALDNAGGLSESDLETAKNIKTAGSVFLFRLFDKQGNLRVAIDSKGKVGNGKELLSLHNTDAARVVLSGQPFVEFQAGNGKPNRPAFYSEAYVPLMRNGQLAGVVEVYIDQVARFAEYRARATNLAAIVGLLAALAFGAPALALFLRSRQVAVAHRELQAQNARFEGAVENMVHGLSMFDADNRLVVANRRYAEMYSLPEDMVVPGKHLLDLVAHALKVGTFDEPRVIRWTMATLEAIQHVQTLDCTWRLADGCVIDFAIARLAGGGWVAVHKDVTQERLAAARLAASEERFRDFAATAGDWCWETDQDHCFTYFTDAFQACTGVDPAAVLGKKRMECALHPDDLDSVQAHARQIGERKPFRDFLIRLKKPDGTFASVRSSGSPRFDAKGRFLGYRGTARDVTEEEKRKQFLRRTETLLKRRSRELVEAHRLGKMGDWSYRLGQSDAWWAPETYELLRYDPQAYRTTRDAIMSNIVGEGAKRVFDAQARVLRSRTVQSVDVKIRRGDGTVGDFVLTSKALVDEAGRAIGFAGTVQDISERKQAEEQLEKLAYYDPLTGLANRALFNRHLNEVLATCGRKGDGAALLLLDLDQFKEVNDSLGHAAGDELLAKIAHLIARVLGTGHFLARLGGDEFAVIVPRCGDRAAVEKLAGAIIATVSGSITLERGEVNIGTSIGVVLIPGDGTNSSDLLRNADLALYRAKEDGRGRFTFFQPDMNSAVQHKIALARDLRRAITENTGLHVHYQPQVDLVTGRVAGYEALMRWNHPTRGNVPPSEFIPIAESSRLICDLGLWIVRHAATQAKSWIDAGEPPREVAVNVSAAQIWHSDLERDVARVLQETGLPPHLLCLELTESLLADHAEGRVRAALQALKGLGVTLALDDFGTDYSSLGYLTQLPFDKLKIDRIFVDGVTKSDRSRELLRGIVGLGRGLGMKVVAEGAETLDEVAILSEFSCHLVQGFAFARPCPAQEALAFAQRCEAPELGSDLPRDALERSTRDAVARLRSAAAA